MQGNVNIPDSTITTNLSFRQLVLMNMQQLTNFPYIEKDFDALTDYELLCLVVKFLNDVIANQNEQNASITRMYESFLALQTYVNNTKDTLEDAFNELDDYVRNYFDNLDVQEEINNKLDQMLEDGVLEQIIEQYIQSSAIWGFDTVADMKSATNLIDGSYAKTLGYYSVNDGGGSTYKIRNITNDDIIDNYQIIRLNDEENELIAELITNSNTINPCQFGAKHNGIDDDSDALQRCLNVLHNHKYKVLDLKGYTYYINKPLYLDSTYKATIKNGEIVALSTFELDEDTNKNYLLYLTNNINEGQPGTPGYATEELTMYNLKFDAQLIDGLGCLNVRYYLRVNIDNCLFRRYKTIGLNSTYQDSHEMILTNSVFNANLKNESNPDAIGINLTGYDNIFSNLVITGGAYGIKMNNVSANTYSKIHTYGCRIYGVYMTNSSQNIFDQFYFDGQGVYIHSPWLTTFINCYFLCNTTPITLDKNNGIVSVLGLKFIGCVGRNYGESSIDIITLPNGNFTQLKQCEFDISMGGTINYNVYSVVGYDNSYVNKVFINSTTQNLLLNANGVIANTGGISSRYTYTAINNIVDVTSYDNTGETHAGFVISLDKNTLYKTINKLDKGQNYKIYGFNSLEQGASGTVVKWDNASSRKYEIFNSGDYDYYVVTFYGKKILQLEVSTLS